jgi:BolA protein
MITEEAIRIKCTDGIEASHVECVMLGAGCEGGAKVELTVVSARFEGVPLLKRHRMVNDLFSEELSSNQIHALTLKCWTPAQYDSKS